ncbi:O-antigen ligase family protein [Cellulomonas sp. P22]|uniref:O-antigen ligase family protein n=1 Tax=Cellulomonas sp. P22 TaxID=3373189 RepID=UPI0037B98A71
MPTPPPAAVHRTGVLTWLTVYVVLLFAIPSRLVINALGSAGAPSMLFGLASALVWFLTQLWRPVGERPSRRPIRLALAIFLVSTGISYVVAMLRPIDHDEISPADVALLVVVSWAGIVLTAHDGLASRRDVDVVVRRFALMGGLMALVGLAQYVTRQPLVDRISVPGLTAVSGVDAFFRAGQVRISGTATHPIEFGALLTILLPLALHGALHPAGLGMVRRWFPPVTIGLALALSMSRSAYVGLAVALLVLLCGWPPRLRWSVGAAVGIGGAALCLAIPPLFRSVRSMFVTAKEDPSITSRTDSYAVALQFIQDAPVFGRGMGTFLPKYRIFDNTFLGQLVSGGLVGTVAFVAIPLTAMVVLLRLRHRWADPQASDLALSLTAGIAAGTVALAFFDGFAFPMTMGTFFLTLGIAGALARLHREDPPDPPPMSAADAGTTTSVRAPAGRELGSDVLA